MSINTNFILFFSFVTHPLVYDVLEFITLAVIVGFTSASSIVRLAIVPFLLMVHWHSVLTCHDRVHHDLSASILGAYSAFSIINYIGVALLDKWAFEASGPTTSKKTLRIAQPTNDHRPKADTSRQQGPNTNWQRFHFGLSAFEGRMIGTPFLVKGVPPFSMEDPTYIPTRKHFLLKESMKFLISYLVVDVYALAKASNDNVAANRLHLVPFFVRLNAVTVQEVAVRIVITIIFWTFIYFVFQAMHSLVAIISVASGLTDVKAWRPLFGSPRKLYTIRQFWGDFWHQLNRRALSSPASWIAYSFLRLRNGGISGRYLFCFLVFFISGLVHVASEVAAGMAVQKSGAVRFFVTQFVGVVLEDTAQECYRRIGGRSGDWKGRALGYVWVFAFLVWSTPAWVYPGLKRRSNQPAVPFSIMGPMLKGLR